MDKATLTRLSKSLIMYRKGEVKVKPKLTTPVGSRRFPNIFTGIIYTFTLDLGVRNYKFSFICI